MTTRTATPPIHALGISKFPEITPSYLKAGQCDRSPTGAHWWDIETANGTTSDGSCRFCNQVRTFWNWFDVKLGDDVNTGRGE